MGCSRGSLVECTHGDAEVAERDRGMAKGGGATRLVAVVLRVAAATEPAAHVVAPVTISQGKLPNSSYSPC